MKSINVYLLAIWFGVAFIAGTLVIKSHQILTALIIISNQLDDMQGIVQ